MGKKRELIAKYDSCEVADSEVEHILECLDDYGETARMIVGWVDHLEGWEKVEKLVDAMKYGEASAVIKNNKEMLNVVKDRLLREVWERWHVFQDRYDMEMESVDEEWKNAGYCGVYAESSSDPPDWVTYQNGSELVRKVMNLDNRSDDFEVWREPDGVLTVRAHGSSYGFIPVEVGLSWIIGKCVVDDENKVFRPIRITGVDNGYLEVEANPYDHDRRRFSEKVEYISERYLVKGRHDEILVFLLGDAIRFRRVMTMKEKLRDLGVAA